jgi:hypothetical protein
MNKEQQELLDEAYMSCMSQNGFKYENGLLVGKIGGLNYDVTYWLTKEEFINKCKTDTEFSEEWGLKIEERELSYEERFEYSHMVRGLYYLNKTREQIEEDFDYENIPTKLITIAYNDKTIESYE